MWTLIFRKQQVFLLVFLSLETLAFEIKILAYEAKNSENLNKKSYLCFNPNSHLDSQNIKKDKILRNLCYESFR